MRICEFTKREIPPGKGKMFVKKDGKVLYFYDGKAEKNFLKLKRKSRTTKWTNEYHQVKKGKKD
ncbi:MAG: 50S ribosomal protein L24e [Candidatus Woesearchaeota archaeon]